ncbi:hypothetical protein GGI04_000841 [Coemansia thaxteri]|uniref:Ribosomal RNA-processing protein 43 n=1 Tax=Coemansia thaxteri TaxID=2663907 RepID=A0A9W8BH25_9FUNG|nr:hypothetical protein H4R26_002162 [Coemansia thaxteri]KAJ2008968.1 hypothetical protein GGI04_000841 [Coemansia thaxteri]KAJ2473597.1 hypothetical protein GGI02_000747 [Coemansia sp. RSA 2322]KAJ2485884.1 hypothetical protein EV174_001458 [Coemansia sp. RSA 2320]
MAESGQQVACAMQTFERLHPTEFQRRFLAQNTRHDGREFMQFRPVQVVKGAISTAQGSATVRVGNTTVVCGIKAEVCEPDVKRPTEGYLATNVELSPMCSAQFRAGAPSEEAQVASEHVHRLAGQMFDLTSLCIESGRAVWSLAADIVCIKHDGGILDAAVVALVAALEDLRLPKAELDLGTGMVSADRTMATHVGVGKRLFPATFALVDDAYVVADADDSEERMATASLLVVHDDRGRLVNVWKRGGGMLSSETIARCVQRARERMTEIAQTL